MNGAFLSISRRSGNSTKPIRAAQCSALLAQPQAIGLNGLGCSCNYGSSAVGSWTGFQAVRKRFLDKRSPTAGIRNLAGFTTLLIGRGGPAFAIGTGGRAVRGSALPTSSTELTATPTTNDGTGKFGASSPPF